MLGNSKRTPKNPNFMNIDLIVENEKGQVIHRGTQGFTGVYTYTCNFELRTDQSGIPSVPRIKANTICLG